MLHRLHYCAECLKKQQVIDRLQEENARLRARLRYQERQAKEGFFGSSTPSAQRPVKANTPVENTQRPGGAQPGHRGHGRRPVRPDQVTRRQRVPAPSRCPRCGQTLVCQGCKQRTVIDVEPVRLEVIRYELEQGYCDRCQRTIRAHPPGVFAKALFGNRLLAYVAVEHYVYGLSMGHLSQQLRVNSGSMWAALHQLAQRWEPVLARLVNEYRQAPVKHADETSWRTDGRGGYAWLFATTSLSLFRFRGTRSAQVAHEVLGAKRVPGVLVVDRYQGYNRVLCALQYCYAHLAREVKDLGQEFPDSAEVQGFVATVRPLLGRAMKLRTLGLRRGEFRQQAANLQKEIERATQASAQHPGIQRIQNIFREHPRRLYHWAKHPAVPADNNLAERELRPLVISRKISFGSQSEQGRRTREILMSILHTLRKRTPDVMAAFQRALDRLAEDETRDPYRALFDSS